MSAVCAGGLTTGLLEVLSDTAGLCAAFLAAGLGGESESQSLRVSESPSRGCRSAGTQSACQAARGAWDALEAGRGEATLRGLH